MPGGIQLQRCCYEFCKISKNTFLHITPLVVVSVKCFDCYISLRKLFPFRSSRPAMFCKKGVVRNFAKFTRKHLCQSLLFNKVTGLPEAWDFFKKETVALVFSGEFWEIFKNTFFKRITLVAASVLSRIICIKNCS